jgi:hypothetical protein
MNEVKTDVLLRPISNFHEKILAVVMASMSDGILHKDTFNLNGTEIPFNS